MLISFQMMNLVKFNCLGIQRISNWIWPNSMHFLKQTMRIWKFFLEPYHFKFHLWKNRATEFRTSDGRHGITLSSLTPQPSPLPQPPPPPPPTPPPWRSHIHLSNLKYQKPNKFLHQRWDCGDHKLREIPKININDPSYLRPHQWHPSSCGRTIISSTCIIYYSPFSILPFSFTITVCVRQE